MQAVPEGSRCSACTGRLMELVWSGPHGLDLDRIESAARVLCLSLCPATLVDRASWDKRKKDVGLRCSRALRNIGCTGPTARSPFRLRSAARVPVAQLLSCSSPPCRMVLCLQALEGSPLPTSARRSQNASWAAVVSSTLLMTTWGPSAHLSHDYCCILCVHYMIIWFWHGEWCI